MRFAVCVCSPQTGNALFNNYQDVQFLPLHLGSESYSLTLSEQTPAVISEVLKTLFINVCLGLISLRIPVACGFLEPVILT